MGWDRHKLLWDGTDKYIPWTTLPFWAVGTRSQIFSIVT